MPRRGVATRACVRVQDCVARRPQGKVRADDRRVPSRGRTSTLTSMRWRPRVGICKTKPIWITTLPRAEMRWAGELCETMPIREADLRVVRDRTLAKRSQFQRARCRGRGHGGDIRGWLRVTYGFQQADGRGMVAGECGAGEWGGRFDAREGGGRAGRGGGEEGRGSAQDSPYGEHPETVQPSAATECQTPNARCQINHKHSGGNFLLKTIFSHIAVRCVGTR